MKMQEGALPLCLFAVIMAVMNQPMEAGYEIN